MASAVPAWKLSIDFGTTSTTAAVSVDGGPGVLLQLEPHSNRMPSAVFLEKDGQLAVGRRARTVLEYLEGSSLAVDIEPCA